MIYNSAIEKNHREDVPLNAMHVTDDGSTSWSVSKSIYLSSVLQNESVVMKQPSDLPITVYRPVELEKTNIELHFCLTKGDNVRLPGQNLQDYILPTFFLISRCVADEAVGRD